MEAAQLSGWLWEIFGGCSRRKTSRGRLVTEYSTDAAPAYSVQHSRVWNGSQINQSRCVASQRGLCVSFLPIQGRFSPPIASGLIIHGVDSHPHLPRRHLSGDHLAGLYFPVIGSYPSIIAADTCRILRSAETASLLAPSFGSSSDITLLDAFGGGCCQKDSGPRKGRHQTDRRERAVRFRPAATAVG